jgi:hypothetical protein
MQTEKDLLVTSRLPRVWLRLNALYKFQQLLGALPLNSFQRCYRGGHVPE